MNDLFHSALYSCGMFCNGDRAYQTVLDCKTYAFLHVNFHQYTKAYLAVIVQNGNWAFRKLITLKKKPVRRPPFCNFSVYLHACVSACARMRVCEMCARMRDRVPVHACACACACTCACVGRAARWGDTTHMPWSEGLVFRFRTVREKNK